MNTQQIQEFLGWCTVINLAIITVSTIALIIARDMVKKIHSKLFKLSDENLDKAYFRYLANYKIAIIVFSLVPYLALKVMGCSCL